MFASSADCNGDGREKKSGKSFTSSNETMKSESTDCFPHDRTFFYIEARAQARPRWWNAAKRQRTGCIDVTTQTDSGRVELDGCRGFPSRPAELGCPRRWGGVGRSNKNNNEQLLQHADHIYLTHLKRLSHTVSQSVRQSSRRRRRNRQYCVVWLLEAFLPFLRFLMAFPLNYPYGSSRPNSRNVFGGIFIWVWGWNRTKA